MAVVAGQLFGNLDPLVEDALHLILQLLWVACVIQLSSGHTAKHALTEHTRHCHALKVSATIFALEA